MSDHINIQYYEKHQEINSNALKSEVESILADNQLSVWEYFGMHLNLMSAAAIFYLYIISIYCET